MPRPVGDKRKRGGPKAEAPALALALALEATGDQQQQQQQQQMEARTMALPACRVSRSAQQILELAITTLAEAADRSNTRYWGGRHV